MRNPFFRPVTLEIFGRCQNFVEATRLGEVGGWPEDLALRPLQGRRHR